MIELWLGITLLTLLALAFIFGPFIQARKLKIESNTALDRKSKNIEIFKERLAELNIEKEAGNLQVSEYDELKLELERNLLDDASVEAEHAKLPTLGTKHIVTVALIALMIPALAFGLYFKYGSANELQAALEQPAAMKAFADGKQPTVEEAIAMLVAELEKNPENPEGWYILATTYMNIGEFEKGRDSFVKVLEILPQDAPQYVGVMGQYAQSLYFAKGGKMDDEVRQQVQRTLDREPLEVTSLGLLGIDAFEQSKYEEAIAYWRQALANAEPAAADSLKAGVRRAMDELVALGKPVPDVPELQSVAIQVRVDIDPKLRAQLNPDQTVFVFAKPVGGRMPLAAVKLTVGELPKQITLDDSLAMTAQAKLSMHPEITVGARISMSGQPQASQGDLQSSELQVIVKDTKEPLTLMIDQIVQ